MFKDATGDLIINEAQGDSEEFILADVLPNLEHIDGDLIIDPTSSSFSSFAIGHEMSIVGDVRVLNAVNTTKELNLSNVTVIGGALIIRNQDIEHLDLSSLSVAGAISIRDNLDLSTLEVPNLTMVREAAHTIDENDNAKGLDLWNNNFERIEMPLLATAQGGISISEEPELVSISFPVLESVGLPARNNHYGGGFLLYDNVLLEEVNLPLLTTMRGNLDMYWLQSPSGQMSTLSLPKFASQEGSITIIGSDLQILDLSALEWVAGSFYLGNNLLLGTLDLRSLQSINRMELMQTPTENPGILLSDGIVYQADELGEPVEGGH